MLKIVKLKVDNLKCSDRVKDKISYLQNLALSKGYRIKAYYYKGKEKKIVFEKESVLIVINLEINSVVTTLTNHPKFKSSKLKRSGLSLYQVGSIIVNPRQHTGTGSIISKIEKDGKDS